MPGQYPPSSFESLVGQFLNSYGMVKGMKRDQSEQKIREQAAKRADQLEQVKLNEAGYDRLTMPTIQAPPPGDQNFAQKVGGFLSDHFGSKDQPQEIVMKTHPSAHDEDVANEQQFITGRDERAFAHTDLLEGIKAKQAADLKKLELAGSAANAQTGAQARITAAQIAAHTPDWTAVDDTDPTTGQPRKMKLDKHSGAYNQIGGGKASGSSGGGRGATSSLREMLDADASMANMEPSVVLKLSTSQEMAATQAASSAHATAQGTGGLAALAGQALGSFAGQHVLDPDVAEYDRNARSFGMQSTQALKGRQSDQKVTRDIQLSRVFSANRNNPNVLKDTQGTRRNLILMAVHDNPGQLMTLTPAERDRLRGMGANIPDESKFGGAASGGNKVTINGKTFVIPD